MNEEQATNSDSNPDNPIIPQTAASEYVPEVESDQKYSTAHGKPCDKNEQPPINFKVDVHIPKDKSSFWSNGIQIVSVAVNAVMLLFTFWLFTQTKESVEIADNALKDSRYNDSVNRRNDIAKDSLDSIRYEENRIKDKLTIDLANRSLGAQIGSLKQTQRQFEAGNTPYLQVSNAKFWDSLKVGRQCHLFYFLNNSGLATAKVIRAKFKLVWEKDIIVDPTSRLDTIPYDSVKQNSYIPYNNPQTTIYNSPYFVTRQMIHNVKEHNWPVQFFGEFQYINVITNEKRICVFNAVVYPGNPNPIYNVAYLENRTVSAF